MKYFYFLIYTCLVFKAFTQEVNDGNTSNYIISTEIMLGGSTASNSLFPKRGMQTQFTLGLAKKHENSTHEWAYRLKYPKTGLTVGYTNFGNSEALGSAITVMPFIAFDVFKRPKKDLKLHLGLGGSYFTENFDAEVNPYNRAISTTLTWSYRATLFYTLKETQTVNYYAGLTYFHHSNGHTKLPNQGFNSFLVSTALDFKTKQKKPQINTSTQLKSSEKSFYNYMSFRYGLGFNTFSFAYNYKKPVNTFSAEYGKVWSNTFKVGLGFYYRHYEHYQNYIENNQYLVQEGQEFESLKSKPFINASALGLFINGEFLLNYIGIDFQIGGNLFKPAYKIDWRINQGWENPPRELPENWMLGEYTTYFKLKHIISTRMGLKYYLIGTAKKPEHNVFVAAHINSNLGQADFSELSLGYVYSFNKQTKPQ